MAENENEWQLNMTSINDRLGYIYNQKILTDIEIIVGPKGNENQESFHAHTFVLILGSPIFEEMLRNLSAENEDQIFLPDISPRAFHNMLKYLYTDNSRFADENEAVQTYQAADNFLITGLMHECQNYASELQLSPENVCNALEASYLLKVVDLKQRCLKRMEQETAEVLKSTGFLASNMETVESILKLSGVSLASEAELLESVILWGINQIAKGKFQKTLRHVIEPFLPHIQFMSMTIQELSRVIKRNGNIFNETEILGLFMNIARQGSYELPSWCTTSVSRDLTSRELLPVISVLGHIQIFSFSLNSKDENIHMNVPQLFRITLRNNTEYRSFKVTGIKLQFSTKNSTGVPELRYEVSSLSEMTNVLRIESRGIVFGQKEETVKFAIPAELHDDWTLTIQAAIFSAKWLTFPRLQSPVMGFVLPFRYWLKAPYGTFVISELYYYQTNDLNESSFQ